MKRVSVGNLEGFTLIELLVVVLIIGILSAIALPQYEKAVLRSRMAGAFPVVRAVQTAMEEYELANGTPPDSMDDILDMTGYPNMVRVSLGISQYRVGDYVLIPHLDLKHFAVIYAPGSSQIGGNGRIGAGFSNGKIGCAVVPHTKDGAYEKALSICKSYSSASCGGISSGYASYSIYCMN